MKRRTFKVGAYVCSFLVGIGMSVTCANAEMRTGSSASGQSLDVEFLEEFFGKELVNASRKRVPVSELAGKRIGLYFSASWCPPCRTFTPKLVEAYTAWQKEGLPFEIVFISRDRSAPDMVQYMRSAKMPWLAVPYGSRKIDALCERFNIRGIPTLVVIDAEGKTLATDARGAVERQGADAIQRW